MKKHFLYEVVIPRSYVADLNEINKLTHYNWSTYTIGKNSYYFFAEETDAMAFKLKYF